MGGSADHALTSGACRNFGFCFPLCITGADRSCKRLAEILNEHQVAAFVIDLGVQQSTPVRLLCVPPKIVKVQPPSPVDSRECDQRRKSYRNRDKP